MAAQKSTTSTESPSDIAPAETADDPIGEFLQDALKLVTAFQAISRLNRDLGGGPKDHALELVTKHGAAIAGDLATSIDLYSLRLAKLASESSHG